MTAEPLDPTEGAVIERAGRLANRAMFTVALQVRRLGSDEPEDDAFPFRRWADWDFLIVALRRLQRAAELAALTSAGGPVIAPALARFRSDLPGLESMRNVAEHVDAYAIDSPDRHDKAINRRNLEVGQFSGEDFVWLDKTINAQQAKSAAERLLAAVKSIRPAR